MRSSAARSRSFRRRGGATRARRRVTTPPPMSSTSVMRTNVFADERSPSRSKRLRADVVRALGLDVVRLAERDDAGDGAADEHRAADAHDDHGPTLVLRPLVAAGPRRSRRRAGAS